MTIYHDSRSTVYRAPVGAVTCGTKVTLRVRAEGVCKVQLRLWWDDAAQYYDMEPIGGEMYETVLNAPKEPGLLWYFFIAEEYNGNRWYYGNAQDGLGGVGDLSSDEPASYQITVYDEAYRTPEWLRNGVMMQIMVDRFNVSGKPDPRLLPAGSFLHARWDEDPVLIINDRNGDYVNNDFFGGNLKGVQEKLGFLADMGVSVIYFNPIFKSRSNHKYDTGDYMKIDPSFGTEEDFRNFCQMAAELGIRVILDGVFSHTGADSRYFNKKGTYGSGGAYNDPNSPYAGWYLFEQWPDRYVSWWGFKTLPNLNKQSPAVRRFIIGNKDSVVAHWLRAGASGWRLDVADELPMDFLREMRKREKEVDPNAALIGEVWEDPSNKVAYGKMRSYVLGDTLDSTMNYPLRDAIMNFLLNRIDAGSFVRHIESMRENLPPEFLYSEMNLLGSHDKPRALTVLADIGDMEPDRRFRHAFEMEPEAYARGKRRLITAWMLVCALPGMPCVYYGDDAGLYGMSDPFCRGTYPWGHEDTEIQKAFRSAIHKRNQSHALRTGSMKLTACGADVVIVEREIVNSRDEFGRRAPDEINALAVNRASESRWIEYNNKTIELKAESALWLR